MAQMRFVVYSIFILLCTTILFTDVHCQSSVPVPVKIETDLTKSNPSAGKSHFNQPVLVHIGSFHNHVMLKEITESNRLDKIGSQFPIFVQVFLST